MSWLNFIQSAKGYKEVTERAYKSLAVKKINKKQYDAILDLADSYFNVDSNNLWAGKEYKAPEMVEITQDLFNTPEEEEKPQEDTFLDVSEGDTCHTCHQTIREYTHSLSSGLVLAFIHFAQYLQKNKLQEGNAVNDAGLSVNEANNFQKLQYFGLVKKGSKRGLWTITNKGAQWLAGQMRTQKAVTTKNGVVLKAKGDMVTIADYDHEPIYFQKEF